MAEKKTKEEIIEELIAQNILISQAEDEIELTLKKDLFKDAEGHLLEAVKSLNRSKFYFGAQKDNNQSKINLLNKPN